MNQSNSCGKTLASLLGCVIYFSAVAQAQATLLSPAQSPLILSESVAPNLILTLDDSGSMRWAYTPDNIDSLSSTRRAKSSSFNPMYYNPNVTYTVPVRYDGNGARSSTQYSTTFNAAFFNGFQTARDSINLSNSYRATWAYNPSTTPQTSGLDNSDFGDQSTSNSYAENPAADFGGATISTQTTPGNSGSGTFSGTDSSNMKDGQTRDLTANGVTFRVTRTGTTTCTATLLTTSSTSTPSTSTETNTPSQGYTTTISTTRTTNYLAPLTCSRNVGTYTLGAATTYSDIVTTTVSRDNLTRAAVPAYYYRYDTSLADCNASTTDDDCYRLVTVSATSGTIRTDDSAAGTDERANFARWYSFYRNRALATLSAANLAFTSLPRSIRLTWQNLGTCTAINSNNCGPNYLRKFTSNHVGNFFNWLPTITFNSSTPLLDAMIRAGNFIATPTPWANDPNPLVSGGGTGTTIQSPEYACRASYHIMMTDGMWNDNTTAMPSPFRHDAANLNPLPDGVGSYTQQNPFKDTTANTLADLAFHYWATDARSGLSNELKPIIVAPNSSNPAAQYWDPRNDPATWQHLNTFTVGLGLNSSLQQANLPWTGDTFSGAGYTALVNGTQNWPAASDRSPNNVYDLWHAAINSRGEFFSADSPDAIVNAFRDIISRISNRTTSAGAPGVTASIVEDTLTREVYETKFNSEDWSGDLTKFRISDSGVRTAIWSAQSQLNNTSASLRNIKMYSATATSKLQDFSWSNLSPSQQVQLSRNDDQTNAPADLKGEDRLNYLRGDQSYEGTDSGAFRIRSSPLGDIVNSSPVIVGTPKYVAYLADQVDGGTLANGSSRYGAFKAANRAELLPGETSAPRRPMVYVGGNDGMLHGFDANTGRETFAYVPSAVIENLYKLPAQRYKGTSHQFYVDGTPTVADVYFDNSWHTVLVGTLRAGGRSLFALDITNPDDIKLLWEKSFSDTGFTNLGYTFPQPAIARLHSGNWAVVIGNGYGNQANATADIASLMIIDIQSGNLQREMIVSGDSTKANGLSSVRLADNNSDGIADYAYAGDLQGNMWRFDLVSTSASPASPDPFRKDLIGTVPPSQFAVSYAGTPLYKAFDGRLSGATAQSITAPPSLVRHPTSLGYIVIFGTGKYFETGDGTIDSTRAMTIYGIWDQSTKGKTTSALSARSRSDLQEQTITEQLATNPFSANETVQGARLVSQNTVEWYRNGNINKHGWYLDLKVSGSPTNSGEMLINPMAVRGKALLLNTLTPNSNPCKEGVDSWMYGIDPTTGGRTSFNVFDLNNDKVINNADTVSRNGADTVVSSYKKPGSGGFTTNNGDIYTAPSQGSGMKYSSGPSNTGRQSWRVIPIDE